MIPTTPDFLFIDAMLLAYRLGRIRNDEQKVALIAAARAAKDAMGFVTALENFGVGRNTQLYVFVGQYLAAPAYYRAQYPAILGLHGGGDDVDSFLGNHRVTSMVEGVLTCKQQTLFYDAYWWFVRNHAASYNDPKKGKVIGAYATDPQDNASTLARFADYLMRLVNHSTQRVRELYESFPADIVIAILQRAWGSNQG